MGGDGEARTLEPGDGGGACGEGDDEAGRRRSSQLLRYSPLGGALCQRKGEIYV
jgi:hypothetical protein